ncbi:hypothetical protein [Kutzneria albida]|uniref:Uncharacterized protein n=1 Tax=Kutzneria albida DSM 43870 TaxID=1449976 RepID=W5WCT0_9PSEU|nr:hypothetical protein [Kutzneria albida]AHH98565.1 hypothetical protein KALB_5203 [Kutzneria albida DSM 43870]
MRFGHQLAVHLLDGAPSVVVLGLTEDHHRAFLRLGSPETFTVSLDVSGIAELVTAVLSGHVMYVPVRHAVHGDRLLGVHPHPGAVAVPEEADCGPRQLYLELPGKLIYEVVLDPLTATRLVRYLDEAWRLIDAAG